jgi:plastocyanin
MTRRFRWLYAMLAVVALLGAACGGDTADDGGATPTTAAPTDGGGGATLELVDFAFSPTDLTVSSGDTLTLSNEGATPHTFTIADEGIDEQVASGESGEVTIDLDPGSYDFVCTLHESEGMVGTLTVE